MAGCEYLDNIERMGLKSALKQFDEHKTFDEVMKNLEKHKTFKDKIPKGYKESLHKVSLLFNYQTVYDPRSKRLTQLQPVDPGVTLDMDYMGRHEVFERYLVEFTQGWVVRGTFEKRKRYTGQTVIDMSKIRMDFARNEISD